MPSFLTKPKLLIFAGFLFGVMLLLSGGHALAADGWLDNQVPSTSWGQHPWMVVTRPGSNGMDAGSQRAHVYVPVAGPGDAATFTMTVNDGCETGNDDNPANNNTLFSIWPAFGFSVSGGTNEPIFADHQATQCTSGSDVTFTTTLPASGYTNLVQIQAAGGVTRYYRSAVVTANVTSGSSAYYVNRFRFSTGHPGALFAFAETGVDPAGNQGLYTGIAHNVNPPNGWGWTTSIMFAQYCNAGVQTRDVYFYDTDDSNAAGSSSPYWQNNNQPMTWHIHAFDRVTGAYIGPVPGSGGALKGGNNQADRIPGVSFDSRYIYRLDISNVNYVNSIQVALPYPQINAIDTCQPGNQLPGGAISASCDVYGTLSVSVNAWDPDGGNVGVNIAIPTYGNASGVGSGNIPLSPSSPYPGRPRDGVTYTITGNVSDAQTGQVVGLASGTFNCPVPPPTSMACPTAPNGGQITFPPDEYGVVDTLGVWAVNNTSGAGATQPTITSIQVSSAPGATGLPANAAIVTPAPPGGNSRVGNVANVSFPAPNRYAISYTVNWSGLPNGAITCVINEDIYAKPYIKAYGADIWAGGGFTSGGSCVSNTNAAINAFASANGGTYRGSSAQFGITALMGVNEFYSAGQRTGANRPPRGLTFSNTLGSTYGGNFGGSGLCITDYFNATRDPSVPEAAWPGTLSANQGKRRYTASNVAIGAGVLNAQRGTQAALYVTGSAMINNDIRYVGGATSANDLPFFALIVCGDIYINSNVQRIDGLYVAQPGCGGNGRIYTCAPSAGSLYSTQALYDSCNDNQLSVNGALIGQQVRFFRTRQTLNLSPIGASETPNLGTGAGTNAAEVVNYTPELWMAPSPLLDPASSSAAGEYDAIIGLPPVF